MPHLPINSVRGPVRGWLSAFQHLLAGDVLEVGSRRPSSAWWADNRSLAFPGARWLGLDMQPGDGVDVVGDVHKLPEDWSSRFDTVVCSEVLEHVERPWVALPELARVTKPGGHLIVTAPFCFPVHAYPSDYFRYTMEGLRVLMQDAGFEVVTLAHGGTVDFLLNDHGEPGQVKRSTYRHALALGRKPPCSNS